MEEEFEKRKNLIPNPWRPGEFIENKNEEDKYRLKFLFPESWVYHPDVVRHVLNGEYDKIMPYSAEFVTTLNCTNRCLGPCSYCLQRMCEGISHNNDFKNPRIHMQSYEFAREMMDKLLEGGVKGITFTGGGEPSLFNRLEDIMKYTSGKADMILYTNGNSWTEERIKRVVESSPKIIRVSMNCGTKERYDKFHRPFNKNAFQTVLKSTECFAKYCKNTETSFGVSFIMNEENYRDIPETAKRLLEIIEKVHGGIDFAAYRPSFNYCGSVQTSSDILDESFNLVENEVRSILKNTGIKVSNIKCRYDALKSNERGYRTCRATGLYAEMAPNGELHTCCDRNCYRPFCIGDLKKNTVEEIYSSEKRKNVLSYANDFSCTTCPIACKPHEANKQFEIVEQLREKKEMYKLEAWIDAIHNLPKPKLINF